MSGKIKREELASELVDELDKDLKIRKISAGQAGGRLEEGPQEGGVEEHERLVHAQHDPSLRRHLQSFSAGDHLVRERWKFFSNIIATTSTWLKASSNTCTCRCCFFAILGPTRSKILTKSFSTYNFHFLALSHLDSQSVSWCLAIFR